MEWQDLPCRPRRHLDCGSAATYNVVGAIRLATSPATLETPVLTTGTVEAGTTSLVNSCKLVSGGRLPVHPYARIGNDGDWCQLARPAAQM